MNNYLSNPSWINQTRKNKFLKVINIFVTMTFLFNMTAFQGIFLTFPIQADAETVSNLDKTLFTSLDNSNELIPFNNGSLEVTKVVVGGNATADQFGFRLAGGVERYLYPNSGVSNVLFKNLIPGIYSVEEENNMPDYHQTDSTCTDVTVVDGQQASCTITNTRDTGTLIVIKQINNDDGGTVLASDWTIDVTGPQTVPSFPGTEDPGTTNSVITGDYNVTETGGPSGYTLSYSGDCDQNGDITIGYNETKTCILTNTYNPPEEPEVTLPTIEVNKSVSKGAAEVNETLTYLVEWRVTDADATNLTITDPIPLNSTFVLADNGGVYSTADNAVTWSLGTKSPGDSGIFTIAVTVNSLAEAGAMIVNTATIDCDETDPVSDDASTVITTSTAPILQITKDVSDSPVNPGDTVTYTVVITNVGSEDATNLTLTDVMPTNLTFADGGDNTKTFTLGDLAIGDSVTKTYDVVVSNNSGAGTYTNTATAEADNHSPISAEVDVDVVLPTVLGEVTTPDLSITKVVNVEFANPGDIVEYTVTLVNNGDGDAVNVVLTDQLPAGFTYDGTTDSVKAWELGNIVPGEEKITAYATKIGADTTAGVYDNLAIASADNHDDITATVPLEVRAIEVLGATLEETGTSGIDYLLYLLGIGVLTAGIWVSTRKEKQAKAK